MMEGNGQKMPKAVKPKKKTRRVYDYNECSDYLQKKYRYNEQDYAGRYTRDENGGVKNNYMDIPYLNFWHWVANRWDIHNGGVIVFCKGDDDYAPSFVKEIFSHYIDEFGDGAEFETSW